MTDTLMRRPDGDSMAAPAHAPGPFTAAVAPKTYEQAMRFCHELAHTELVPKAFRGRPHSVLVCIMMGEGLGYGVFQSLQNIAVVNGKPQIYGDEPLARVQRCREYEWHREDDLTTIAKTGKATCTIKRRGNAQPIIQTYTLDMARKAKLINKPGPWQEYTERMLQLRARSFALRNAFADALSGVAILEEHDHDIRDIVTGEPATRPADASVTVDDRQVDVSAQGLPRVLAAIAAADSSQALEATAEMARSLGTQDAAVARAEFIAKRKALTDAAAPKPSKAQRLMQRAKQGSDSPADKPSPPADDWDEAVQDATEASKSEGGGLDELFDAPPGTK